MNINSETTENGFVAPENATTTDKANEIRFAATNDIETLKLASHRMRQSGKTTLARQLETIADNIRAGLNHVSIIPTTNEVTQKPLDVPQFVPMNGEIDRIKWAIAAGQNVMLTGDSGCGKTHLAQWVCQELGRPFFEIQGGAGASFERIIGQDRLDERNGASVSTWANAILPLAMQTPNATLYIDEPNSIPTDVLFYLHSAGDDRRTITFADGRQIKAAEGFQIIGAMNEGYSGTALMNAATRQRFHSTIQCHYLSKAREAKLIAKRTGIDLELAKQLAALGENLRSLGKTNKQLRTPISTRMLLNAAALVKVGAPVLTAAHMTITEQVPSQFAAEKKAVSDAVVAYFGGTTEAKIETSIEE
jgi:MoxR-like ATPases